MKWGAAMDKEGRVRMLRILQILQAETDEQHPVSIVQLEQKLMERWEIPAHRITVQSDIAALQKAGYRIEVTRSTQNRYFYKDRLFKTPELKLLIDAVESSKFITARKSRVLADKLTSLAPEHVATELIRNTSLPDRIKAHNEKIYAITDALNDGINRQRKVSFRYFHYDGDKKKRLKNGGNAYVLSPYSLTWNGDHYYVVGWSEKHQKIATFRVDRIYDIPIILEEDAVKKPRDYSIGSFTERAFRMFDTAHENVTLLCDNSMMGSVIDHFGTKVKATRVDENHFQIEVEVSVSPTFFAWVFEFGGKIKIISPKNVETRWQEMLAKASGCQ